MLKVKFSLYTSMPGSSLSVSDTTTGTKFGLTVPTKIPVNFLIDFVESRICSYLVRMSWIRGF